MSTHRPVNDRIGYRLKVAQHALHRRMRQVLHPLGLTPAQYAVLVALEEKPDQTNADLAEAAFITAQSMQGVLAGLEREGYVRRRADRHHGRRQLARITTAGREMVARAHAEVAPVEQALERALAPVEREAALALMSRLQEAMQEAQARRGETAGAEAAGPA